MQHPTSEALLPPPTLHNTQTTHVANHVVTHVANNCNTPRILLQRQYTTIATSQKATQDPSIPVDGRNIRVTEGKAISNRANAPTHHL
jgi:hypothetical protein